MDLFLALNSTLFGKNNQLYLIRPVELSARDLYCNANVCRCYLSTEGVCMVFHYLYCTYHRESQIDVRRVWITTDGLV